MMYQKDSQPSQPEPLGTNRWQTSRDRDLALREEMWVGVDLVCV